MWKISRKLECGESFSCFPLSIAVLLFTIQVGYCSSITTYSMFISNNERLIRKADGALESDGIMKIVQASSCRFEFVRGDDTSLETNLIVYTFMNDHYFGWNDNQGRSFEVYVNSNRELHCRQASTYDNYYDAPKDILFTMESKGNDPSKFYIKTTLKGLSGFVNIGHRNQAYVDRTRGTFFSLQSYK